MTAPGGWEQGLGRRRDVTGGSGGQGRQRHPRTLVGRWGEDLQAVLEKGGEKGSRRERKSRREDLQAVLSRDVQCPCFAMPPDLTASLGNKTNGLLRTQQALQLVRSFS